MPRSKTKKEVLSSPTTTTTYRIVDLSSGLFFVKCTCTACVHAAGKIDRGVAEPCPPSWEFGGSLFSSPDEAAASLQAVSSKISPLWCIQEITITPTASFSIPPPRAPRTLDG